MTSKNKALKRLHTRGGLKKMEKQVYHRKGRVYHGKGPKGSGHQAGEKWGEAKKIDPESKERVYSRKGRSPSFDQGVRNYKTKALNKAISEAKLDKYLTKYK